MSSRSRKEMRQYIAKVKEKAESRERFEKEAELIVASCACATQLEELRDEQSDTYRTMVLNVVSGLQRAERDTRERIAQLLEAIADEDITSTDGAVQLILAAKRIRGVNR